MMAKTKILVMNEHRFHETSHVVLDIVGGKEIITVF